MSIETIAKSFGELVKSVGFPIVVAGFVIWHNYDMNEKLSRQLESTQSYVRDTLTSLVRDTTIAVKDSTEATRENTEVLERVCDRLESK